MKRIHIFLFLLVTCFILNGCGTQNPSDSGPEAKDHTTATGNYGEPIGSGIAQIFFNKNFSVLAVQLAGTNGDSSRFLVLNAADREDALSQYTALLESKELKNY